MNCLPLTESYTDDFLLITHGVGSPIIFHAVSSQKHESTSASFKTASRAAHFHHHCPMSPPASSIYDQYLQPHIYARSGGGDDTSRHGYNFLSQKPAFRFNFQNPLLFPFLSFTLAFSTSHAFWFSMSFRASRVFLLFFIPFLTPPDSRSFSAPHLFCPPLYFLLLRHRE